MHCNGFNTSFIQQIFLSTYYVSGNLAVILREKQEPLQNSEKRNDLTFWKFSQGVLMRRLWTQGQKLGSLLRGSCSKLSKGWWRQQWKWWEKVRFWITFNKVEPTGLADRLHVRFERKDSKVLARQQEFT